MPRDKVVDLATAIATHVEPGMSVALEGFGHLAPTAAAHELIRQRLTGLTLCRMSCDLVVDQLLAAGVIDGLVSSFVANSSGGSLHELRRAVQSGDTGFRLEEYSHGGMVARYTAGAARLPFYPIRSYQGSDLRVVNPMIREVADPYGGEPISVVPPLNPDVSIIHAQRADRRGNIQAWGILGIQAEVAFSGRRVIVTVEEIVDDDVVRSDPNRTIVPAQVVDAVVPVPWGSYPSSVQGHYDRDDGFVRRWSELARTPGAVSSWIAENIHGRADYAGYVASLPPETLAALRVGSAPARPVDYGRSRRAELRGDG